MKVIAITGGIGAGKSAITSFLKNEGYQIFDCDAEVHLLYREPQVLEKLTKDFGDLGENPRRTMSGIVAANPDVLDYLDHVFHRPLSDAFHEFKRKNMDQEFCILDAPILIERDMIQWTDFIVSISVPLEIRHDRVMQRPGMTEEKWLAITGKQLSEDKRNSYSHYVIFNTTTIQDAQFRMQEILTLIRQATHV